MPKRKTPSTSMESTGVARAAPEGLGMQRSKASHMQTWMWIWSAASTITLEEKHTSSTRLAWRASTQKMFLFARRMAGRLIVQPAVNSRLTEHTIVGKLIDVYAKWITFAPGRLPWLSTEEERFKSLTGYRVGGVVSETSFKFFIQFVVYTAIFCGYLLIVTAYYTAEIRRNVSITYSLRQQQ